MAQANINAVITADDKASGVLKGFANNVDSANTKVKDIANKTAVALGAAGAGLTLLAKNATDFTVDYVKNAKQLARETGATVEESSRLMHVTERMGISVEQASASFGIFSKNIKQSSEESAKAADAQVSINRAIEKTKLQIKATTRELEDNNAEIKKNGDESGDLGFKSEQLGFRIKDLNNDLGDLQKQLTQTTSPFAKLGIATKNNDGSLRTFNEILLDTADKFRTMPNGIDKTALSLELFGRSGKDLLPVLNLGSKGIAALEAQADKLGLTLSGDNVVKISQYIESQKKLKDSTTALKLAIGETTAPVMTAFNTKISEITASLLATDSPMKGLTANLLAFGGPALSFGASAIAVAANLSTIVATAGSARAALAAVAVPWQISVAIVGVAAVIYAIKELNDWFNKTIENLNKVQVKLNNTNFKVPGGSDLALVQQFKAAFGMRAEGGPVKAGQPYIVGEREPEVFVPNQSGRVLNQRQLSKQPGVGNPSMINININTGALMGTDVEAK